MKMNQIRLAAHEPARSRTGIVELVKEQGTLAENTGMTHLTKQKTGGREETNVNGLNSRNNR